MKRFSLAWDFLYGKGRFEVLGGCESGSRAKRPHILKKHSPGFKSSLPYDKTRLKQVGIEHKLTSH